MGLEVCIEEDALGLDVAVDDGGGVEHGEAPGDSQGDEVPHRPVKDVPVEVGRLLQESRQVAVRHVVVDQKAHVGWRAGVVPPEDGEVAVLDPAQRLRLLPEGRLLDHDGAVGGGGGQAEDGEHRPVVVAGLKD